MTYLSHKASFHSIEWIAPSNPGIKHLGALLRSRRAQPGHWDFSLRALAAEEMLYALEIWRCYAAMKPAIDAARSEVETVNSQGAGRSGLSMIAPKLAMRGIQSFTMLAPDAVIVAPSHRGQTQKRC
ncbi:hypothetical protein [Cribrihabitans pelagius]|uniref:hypothetical protein n=1 Tax=Cribrihabitans pelagius TaxID=1765746 RepID=UPI003B5C5EDE